MLVVTAASALAGVLFAPNLPDRMASHWNLYGQVDGTMPKAAALLLFPGMIAGIYVLFLGMVAILPLRANVDSFRPQLNLVFVGLGLFLAYLTGVTLAWNLGLRFRIEQAFLPGIAALTYLVGHVLGRAKRNWVFGIRTPWTLSADDVWVRTHRLGGIVFRVCAVLMLVGGFAGNAAWVVVLGPIVLGSVLLVVYSYWLWRQAQV
jgi:uncharacterized membrane protein